MMREVISSSSKTYSQALYLSAAEKQIEKVILSQFADVCDILSKTPDLVTALSNPALELSVKLNIVDECFSKSINVILLNFLKIIIERNRFSEINSIFCAYKNQYEKCINIKDVQVVSAFNLSEETKTKISDTLKSKLCSEINIDWHTDEDIIGGLIFKFDDYVVDTCVKTKLENISKNLLR